MASKDYISMNRYSKAGESSNMDNLNDMIQTLLMGSNDIITDIIKKNLEPEENIEKEPEIKNIRDDILTILKIDEERFRTEVHSILQQEMITVTRRLNESVDETIRNRLFTFFNTPSTEQQMTQVRNLFDESHTIDKNVLPMYDTHKRGVIQKYVDITRPFACFKVARYTQTDNIMTIFTENFILQERFLQNTWTPANVIEAHIPLNLLLFYKTVSRMVNQSDARRFETVWRSTPEIFLDRSEHLERKYQTELERIKEIQTSLQQELLEAKAKDDMIEKLKMENQDLHSHMDGYLRSKQKLEAESTMMNKFVTNLSGNISQLQDKFDKRIGEIEQSKRLVEFENEKLKDQTRMLAMSVTELKRDKIELEKAIEQYQLDREEFYKNFNDYQEFKIQRNAFEAEKNTVLEMRRVLTMIKTNLERERDEVERMKREIELEHRREFTVPPPTNIQTHIQSPLDIVVPINKERNSSITENTTQSQSEKQSDKEAFEKEYNIVDRENGKSKIHGKLELQDFFIQKKKNKPA